MSVGRRRVVRRGRVRAAAGIVLGSIVLVVLLVGCSAAGSGGTAASPVVTTTVDLPPSYRFAPTAITVKAGATVTWTNHDNFSHSVAFLDGGLAAAPLVMKPGETTTFTFPSAGTYHYQCSFHPQNMQGTVVVTAP
jgi:plastocyanin